MYFQFEKVNYLDMLNPPECLPSQNITPDDVAADWADKNFLKCYCDS